MITYRNCKIYEPDDLDLKWTVEDHYSAIYGREKEWVDFPTLEEAKRYVDERFEQWREWLWSGVR